MPPVFPLTFHLLHKRRKMCESAPKLLWNCCSSGFVMSPFHKTNLQTIYVISKKKGHCITDPLFSVWLAKASKKSCTANPMLSAFFQKHCFVVLKIKNAEIKHRFALLQNLCESAVKYFALIGNTVCRSSQYSSLPVLLSILTLV